MKKIEVINGYAIYEATERDEKKYNVTAGSFYIYFNSEIREQGISNCADYFEWEADSQKECEEWIEGSNTAKAMEIVAERTTFISCEEVEGVENMLNAGMGVEEIEEVLEGEGENDMNGFISEKNNGIWTKCKDGIVYTIIQTARTLYNCYEDNRLVAEKINGLQNATNVWNW